MSDIYRTNAYKEPPLTTRESLKVVADSENKILKAAAQKLAEEMLPHVLECARRKAEDGRTRLYFVSMMKGGFVDQFLPFTWKDKEPVVITGDRHEFWAHLQWLCQRPPHDFKSNPTITYRSPPFPNEMYISWA